MKIDFFNVDDAHLWGDSATHPIEPSATRLGALLFSLQAASLRRRRAYPDAPPAAHSGVSN